MDVNEPREIEHEDEDGVIITRWKVGPHESLSWIDWARYMPKAVGVNDE